MMYDMHEEDMMMNDDNMMGYGDGAVGYDTITNSNDDAYVDDEQ